MFKLEKSKLFPFVLSLVFLMATQASAQFEVSPDHVESPAKKQAAHRPAVQTRKSAASPASKTPPATAPRAQKRAPRKQTGTASASGQPQSSALARK